MKRSTTFLLLCGMLILADLIAAQQIFLMRADLDDGLVRAAILFEVIAAIGTAALAAAVFRKSYRRQKKPLNRERFAIVQPLRRLIVSVWT